MVGASLKEYGIIILIVNIWLMELRITKNWEYYNAYDFSKIWFDESKRDEYIKMAKIETILHKRPKVISSNELAEVQRRFENEWYNCEFRL